MMFRPMPPVNTVTEFFAFQGGLDLTTPALRVPAGSLIASLNYEPAVEGGYARIGGFERYDGRARPSDAEYEAVACTLTITPAAGTLVTIGAATALFVEAVTGGCILTGIVGTIPTNTAMFIAGPTNIGTTGTSLALPSVSSEQDAQYQVDSSDVYRALIQKPPGAGPIRGVNLYNGVLYCFRDNAASTEGQMFAATSGGWTLINLGEVVEFSNANTSVGEGDVLTQGGVTAVISRLFVETGTLASGTNTGRIYITSRTGGNFAGGAATSTGGGALTLSGTQTAVTLSPGGRYEFDNYNFIGASSGYRMYGVNGLDRAFEFDGSIFAYINSGRTSDAPKYIKCHRRYLYLAQDASVVNSSVGVPYRFVTSEGASETAVGDSVTGFASLPGEALGIFCRNSSFGLTGASAATWSLQVIRGDVGAVDYTVKTMSDTYSLDDRGIMSFKTTLNYGNFNDATLSRKIQPIIDALRNKVVGAYVSRQKNLYVLLMNDGSILNMGMVQGKLSGFTTGLYPFIPSCMCSQEDQTGVERIFVGAADGYVYEIGRGSTFDGDNIEAFIKIYYNHSRSPRVIKQYRKVVLEMDAVQYCNIRYQPEFSYGISTISAAATSNAVVGGTGGIWDVAYWNQFYWDGQDVWQPELDTAGSGLNIALTFYSKTKLDFGHTLQGAIVHFTPRRLQR